MDALTTTGGCYFGGDEWAGWRQLKVTATHLKEEYLARRHGTTYLDDVRAKSKVIF